MVINIKPHVETGSRLVYKNSSGYKDKLLFKKFVIDFGLFLMRFYPFALKPYLCIEVKIG